MQRRTKGSGTIQERPDNKWRIRYQVQDKPRKWGSQTINGTRKMAEKALREKLVTLDSGDYVPKTKETVGEFLQSFVNGHCATKLTPKTAQGYKGYIDRYCQPISRLPLQGLPPAKIQSIYSELRGRNLSNTTVLQLHRVLHKAFVVAVREGKLTRNPCDAVTPPKKNSKQAEVWNTDNLERFKNAAQDTRYYDVYRLALRTGMHRSEIAGLRWSDVDLATGTF